MFETLSFPARRAATRTNARASQLLVCLGFQPATLRRISGFNSAYPIQPRRARSASLAPFNFGPPVQPCPTPPAPLNLADPMHPVQLPQTRSTPLAPFTLWFVSVAPQCLLVRPRSTRPTSCTLAYPVHPPSPRPPPVSEMEAFLRLFFVSQNIHKPNTTNGHAEFHSEPRIPSTLFACVSSGCSK